MMLWHNTAGIRRRTVGTGVRVLIKALPLLPSPLYPILVRVVPSQLSKASIIHTHETYTKMIKTIRNPATIPGVRGVRALYTGRFIVLPKPIDLSKLYPETTEVLNVESSCEEARVQLYCFMEDLLDTVENMRLEKAVETIDKELSKLYDEDARRDFIEEYIHSRIFRKTTMWKLHEHNSWKERLLGMYIAEKIHRAVKKLPRTPEKEEIGELDTTKKYYMEIRKEIAKAVDENILRAFKEYTAALYFQLWFYPKLLIPFVEVPTWYIMVKMNLMKPEEVEMRLEDERYFPDPEDEENARRIYEMLSTNIQGGELDKVVEVVNTTLNPPLEELISKIDEALRKKNIGLIGEYLMERFNNALHGSTVKVSPSADITIWDLAISVFKALPAPLVEDVIGVIIDVLDRDREILEGFYSRKISRKYGNLGVLVNLKIKNKGVSPLFIDKFSASCKDNSMKPSPHAKPYIGKVSRRVVSTVEHLVGTLPRAIRIFILLIHRMKFSGIDDTILEFQSALIGKSLHLDSEKLRICLENTKDFEYKGLYSYDEVNAEDVASVLAGTAFLLACLGSDFSDIYGPHGLYLYSSQN
ncbi:MAG: hypothetical protein QW579_01025 [Desulfurococcaceae archaeon]